MSPRTGRSRRAATAVAGAVVAALIGATSAGAISAPIHISGTGGQGVNMRAGAGTSYGKVGWIPEGASPDYICYSWGERINNVPIWFDVNYDGANGFYASAFDDSSYSSDAELQSKYGIPQCGAAPAPSPPPASDPLTFTIANADGGIYYRSSPHWSDTPQTPGVGVYNGDRVRVICGAAGDPVGPFNNTAWSYVTSLSRSVGNGWVNEHYINDGVPSGGWPSGEPQCDASTPGMSEPLAAPAPGPGTAPAPAPAPDTNATQDADPSYPPGGSIYYSPFDGDVIHYVGVGLVHKHYTATVPNPADIRMEFSKWYNGRSCSPSGAIPSPQQPGPPEFTGTTRNGKLVTVLAGWSVGRIGPIWFLNTGGELAENISYVLLFDPGSKDDYYTGACDKKIAEDRIVANWLAGSASRHLVVLAGSVTGDYDHKVNGRAHAGIQNRLFPAIRDFGSVNGRSIRSQVVVCNYPEMNHGDVFIKFRSWIRKPPITASTCPKDGRTRPRGWSP